MWRAVGRRRYSGVGHPEARRQHAACVRPPEHHRGCDGGLHLSLSHAAHIDVCLRRCHRVQLDLHLQRRQALGAHSRVTSVVCCLSVFEDSPANHVISIWGILVGGRIGLGLACPPRRVERVITSAAAAIGWLPLLGAHECTHTTARLHVVPVPAWSTHPRQQPPCAPRPSCRRARLCAPHVRACLVPAPCCQLATSAASLK